MRRVSAYSQSGWQHCTALVHVQPPLFCLDIACLLLTGITTTAGRDDRPVANGERQPPRADKS